MKVRAFLIILIISLMMMISGIAYSQEADDQGDLQDTAAEDNTVIDSDLDLEIEVEVEVEETLSVETDEPTDEVVYEMEGEGLVFSGLPLVNFNADDGVGYGVRLYLHMHKDSPPYAWQLYAQYFATTNGYQYHEINFDSPYFLDSPVRLRASAVIDITLNANYYGLGGPPVDYALPSDLASVETWEENSGLDISPANGNWRKYYQYTIRKMPNLQMTAEYEMLRFDWGSTTTKLRMGGRLRYYYCEVEPFINRAANGKDMYPGIIRSYLAEDNPLGAEAIDIENGVYVNKAHMMLFQANFVWDSRDQEPSPTKGSFSEIIFLYGFGKTVADYDNYNFGKVTMTDRKFFQLYRYSKGNIVFAYRATLQIGYGDMPFYEMRDILYSDGDDGGLGGLFTIRGPVANAFIDKNMAMINAEVRWQIWNVEGQIYHQKWGFYLVGFADLGHCFSQLEHLFETFGDDVLFDTDMDTYNGINKAGLASAAGGSFRLVWNVTTIIQVSYGFSLSGVKDNRVDVDFGHQF